MAYVDISNDPLQIPAGFFTRIGASKNRWRKIGSAITKSTALSALASGALPAASVTAGNTAVIPTDNCPAARIMFGGAATDNQTITTFQVVLWYPLALVAADAFAYVPIIAAEGDARFSALTYAVDDIGDATNLWCDYINETKHRPAVYVVSPADDSCPAYIELDVRGAAGISVRVRRGTATSVDVWLQLGEFISPFSHSGLGEYYTEASVTMAALTTGTVAAHKALLVTGLVRYEIVTECVSNLAGATATYICGTADDADSISGQGTAITATDIDANDLVPVDGADTPVASYIDSPGDVDCVARGVSNGRDIIYTIAGGALTDGTLRWHCRWWPLEPGANIAPGDGSAV